MRQRQAGQPPVSCGVDLHAPGDCKRRRPNCFVGEHRGLGTAGRPAGGHDQGVSVGYRLIGPGRSQHLGPSRRGQARIEGEDGVTAIPGGTQGLHERRSAGGVEDHQGGHIGRVTTA